MTSRASESQDVRGAEQLFYLLEGTGPGEPVKLPSFFLIGAMKAGTTSVYRYLAQHPELFLPKHKEPNFYWIGERPPGEVPADTLHFSVPTRRAYEDLFRPARAGQHIGEGSIRYLISPRAAARIARERPSARFLLVLRDPAERAWSHYGFNRERGDEPYDDFGRALDDEKERLSVESAGFRFGYSWHGLYHHHLRAYDERFPPDRFCIVLYEDLRDDPRAVLRRIFEFLGVDPGFEANTSIRHNVTGEGRGRLIARLLRHRGFRERIVDRAPPKLVSRLGRVLRRRRSALAPELRARLIETCREDVLRLQDRLGRDLARWLR